MKIRHLIISHLIMLVIVSGLFPQALFNARDEGRLSYERYKNRQAAAFAKTAGKKDRGVGILDRGELANVTGNFGVLSNYHLFAPAFHWPSWADDTHQYCFGLELLVGVNGDVVTSIHDPATVAENFDWEATDGSLGNLFSGNATASDGTPILASSDVLETWPAGANNQPFWPGFFRIDPLTGQQVQGEFTSERDVFSEFDDATNQNGSYGLKVLQTDYSFGRTYAKDFIIFDFRITNTSTTPLDSVYVGYMADFKVDYDTHDKIRFGEPGKPKDIVYLWDGDPAAGNWDVTGYIGFLMLHTPGEAGITDFHYFDNIYEPSTNEQLWEIMSSDTSGAHVTRDLYFHGSNYRLDDDALADDMDPSGQKRGTDFVFIVSTGSLSINPGDTVHSAFAVVMGEDAQRLFANAQQAREMSANYYLGYSPPRAPVVYGTTRDGKVVLNWDAATSENSADLLSGEKDFEGYRVYRCEDFGKTWGKIVTDERGNFVDYFPVAQYDLVDDITGKDPFSHYYLGDDSGLQHTFVDADVIKGKEYWYSVTAYDKGNPSPNDGYASLESPRGATPDDQNVVAVTPAASAQGFNAATLDTLTPETGICNSLLGVEIADDQQLTGNRYRVTFTDTLDTTALTLENLDTGDTLISNFLIPPGEEIDYAPVVEGFRLKLFDKLGVQSIGWTKVQGDTCTYEWRTTNFESVASNPQVGPAGIYTVDDIRLTVDYSAGGGSDVGWYDIFTGDSSLERIHIPLKIEVINDPQNPIEIGNQSWLLEYDITKAIFGENRINYFSELGWDLEPGGTGYNKNYNPGFNYGYLWPDIINPEQTVVNQQTGASKKAGLYLITQNYPDTYINQYGDTIHHPAVKPADGDQFTIITNKPFRPEIYYEFSTDLTPAQGTEAKLSEIKIVPNPYIVRAGWERSQFEGRLQFTHLPPLCDIDIYTTAGDHVVSLHHNSAYDYEFWNLQNESGINVAYGLYVYIVKTPDGEKHTGRFVIIR